MLFLTFNHIFYGYNSIIRFPDISKLTKYRKNLKDSTDQRKGAIMSLNYDNIDVRTGYELIQYVNKEFEKYENLTVHYEQSLDCGYETINTFQLMITTEYLDNGKVKLCRSFPAFNYNFKHLFEFHFDDVRSFRDLYGDFIPFDKTQAINDKLNTFLLENPSISVKQFLDFFQNDLLSSLNYEDTKVMWQNETFETLRSAIMNYTQPIVHSHQDISVMNAWLTFIKLFIMDNIKLNPTESIEQWKQKFIIIGFNAGDGHQYE